MKRAVILVCAAIVLSVGCRAQVPPTVPKVILNWTAPAASGSWAGCTAAAPCTYVISRATATSACPATTATNYTPLNQANPSATTTYTDAAPPIGQTACYIAQTVQGGAFSQPSTPSNLIPVPAVPIAPGPPNVGAAAELQELLPAPTLDAKPTKLVARVSASRIRLGF